VAIWKDAERSGIVGSSGWDDDGIPIGGHFTADAMGLNAEADEMLRSIGWGS
jgi:hypothetical protein